MIHAGGPLLSRVRLERLTAAFELSSAEVLADTASIIDWPGNDSELQDVLNARHTWRTDEAFHFIRWVRLAVWCTTNGSSTNPRFPDEQLRH